MPNVMIATKGPRQSNGLFDIFLHAWQNDNYLGHIVVNSGAPHNQVFTTVPTATPRTGQPCPEGEFDLGPLDWASGDPPKGKPGNYNKQFREIESPIWVMIMRGRAIGFHLDGNRDRAPGSAGCLVFKNLADLKRFVNWYLGYGCFSKLYVDWEKGYVKIPAKYKTLLKKAQAK